MGEKEVIIRLAVRVRIFLWLFVTFIILCSIGVPAFFNIEIEPLKNHALFTLLFSLIDHFYPPECIPEQEMMLLTPQEVSFYLGLLAAITTTITILIWQIDRLFRQYAFGNVFTQQVIKHFSMIGWSLIALFVLFTISDNVLDNTLLFQSVSFDTTLLEDDLLLDESYPLEDAFIYFISLDMSLLLAGIFVIVVARVMRLANALQQDVDATI